MNISKFSNLPIDGDTCVCNGRTYTYVGSETTWYASNIEIPIDNSLVEIIGYGSGLSIVTNKIDINNDILWEQVRHIRDIKIAELDWRYNRYNRLARLGLDQIDTLTTLDTYAQALADITKENDPSNIVWPIL